MLLVLMGMIGCENQKIELGAGPEPDARLIADLYTWECTVEDENGDVSSWEGAFSYDIRFQYAPDMLPVMELPASGCNAGADIFPLDAGAGAADLPDGAPDWYNNEDYKGSLRQEGSGYYAESAFSNRRTCVYVEDILDQGTELSNAGSFSGASTPTPGELAAIAIRGAELDENSGLPFGTVLDVSWEATDWDTTWLQIRREQGGSLVEAATCNTTGETSFSIDEDVWGLLHDSIQVDITNLYVGAQSTTNLTTNDGQEIELLTRVMHIAIVQDG